MDLPVTQDIENLNLNYPPDLTTIVLRQLSTETPLEDYKCNMKTEGEVVEDDDKWAYMDTFEQARNIIWQLLFGEPTLSIENSRKAGDLLEAYRQDALCYCPWDYNDWIPLLKEQLLKCKYLDFWQNVIVKKQLGLCWAEDCGYFENINDPRPKKFYKVDEKLL